jgi:hypothetical protein
VEVNSSSAAGAPPPPPPAGIAPSPSPDCNAHPGAGTAICGGCRRPTCTRCLTDSIDDVDVCTSCARAAEADSDALGAAGVGFVGVGYLLTLALSYRIFHARPFLGGLAAIVAIALGRVLQTFFRPKSVIRRG